MRKMRRFVGIAVVLCMIVSAVALTGCGSDTAIDKNTVIHYAIGDKPADMDKIMSLVNARLEKELGLKLEIKFVNNDKYGMLNTGGEYFDSLYVAEQANFWSDVTRDAFAEITREELEEYAPYLASLDKEILEAGTYGGKQYAIPSLTVNYNTNCWVARGDLMDKYGIEDIQGIDGMEKYLFAVAENEKDIIPYDACGTECYALLATMTVNEGWASPGPTNSTAPVQLSEEPTDEKYLELFNVIDHPKTVEFSKRMKEWNKKGVWSRSALSNKTFSSDSFAGGRSAITWLSLDDFIQTKQEYEKDNRKDWDIRAFYAYGNYPNVYSRMINAVAISSASKNKENTLRVIDFILSDPECYRLLRYGIEGEHYSLPDGEHILEFDSENSMQNIGFGFVNDNIGYSQYYNDPEIYEMLNEIKAKATARKDAMLVRGFTLDLSELSVYTSALNQIYQEYTLPRILGFVDNVDEAIKTEKQKLEEAGINEYREKLQAQFDKYAIEKGLK